MKPKAFRPRDERGAAAVEFAIILPVLMLILFGTIQFGLIWSQWQVLEGAAREGARCAAVPASCKQPGQTVQDAVQAAIKKASGAYAPSKPATITYSGTTPSPTACTDGNKGIASVTVSWPQTFSTGALGGLIPGFPKTITGTVGATFRCE